MITATQVAAEPDSIKAPSRAPRLDTVSGLLLVVIAFGIGSRVIGDNSFMTHLATGKLIIAEGAVPTADPYSFTALGEPWTVQSWLASVVYAVGLSVGEWTLRFLNGMLAALAALGLWRLSEPTKNFVVRAGLVGLTIMVSSLLWTPRPLLFAVVGFTALQLALAKRLAPGWLVPVMWVWVNTHGSFPMAGVLAGATLVGAYLDTREAPYLEIRVLGFVTLGTVLGAINPVGLKLLWFPVELLSQGQDKLHNVYEWQPLGLEHRTTLWPLLILVAALAVAVRHGARWRELIPSIVFVIAAFSAVRNAGMAAAVILASAAAWLPAWKGTLQADTRSQVSRLLGGLGLAGAAIVILAPFVQGSFNFDRYPTEEIGWLDDQGLMANPDINVVTSETTGNLLTLLYGREARVFFDDRFDMYPLEINRAYDALLNDSSRFAEILDDYEADVVVWPADGLLATWLADSPEWTVGSSSEDFLVACRIGLDCTLR